MLIGSVHIHNSFLSFVMCFVLFCLIFGDCLAYLQSSNMWLFFQ
uniref:Macaca fascicularis brain cDNA clone: QbsB-10789, similar to human DEAD (Asp-Glu-Ala-Asp) box polypeptide 3, Y-linked(DDX3Y), mRNA, RefSeq: NM_004660.2 n=1 Tax=Macaca fascicularis TaxID=9541 RepID=I7GKV8_MACFA|nr:unnamed protein product [Macaca fascicularis]